MFNLNDWVSLKSIINLRSSLITNFMCISFICFTENFKKKIIKVVRGTPISFLVDKMAIAMFLSVRSIEQITIQIKTNRTLREGLFAIVMH